MLEFANDGGPLLLAPRSPAPFWEGSEMPSAGRVISAASRTVHPVATDYDRACDVNDGAELLDAGPGWVIVLNSEVAGAAWIPLGDDPASVGVVATSGGSDASLSAIYVSRADGRWTILSESLEIGSGGVCLMHAAGIPNTEAEFAFDTEAGKPYATIGDAIVYPLPAGRYRVERLTHLTRRTAVTPGEYTVLVRFSRQRESIAAAG